MITERSWTLTTWFQKLNINLQYSRHCGTGARIQIDGVRTDRMMEKNRGQVIVNKVAALSVITKKCKPAKCPPTGE